MKRTILSLLALILMTGCTAHPQAASEGKTVSIQKKPPTLTVQVGENEGMAALSTYSWDWPNPDGTRSGVEADGMHPLDMLDHVTPIPLGNERTATLRFELGALTIDHLTLRRWDMGCAGDPSKYESDFVMLSFTVNGDTVTVDLPDGQSGIFEVHAYFQGESHGDGYYTFCLQGIATPETDNTSIDLMEAQPVRIVWREDMREQPQAQVIRSRKELLTAIENDEGYESAADLLYEMAATWNDDRFAQYDLILLRIESGSGSISYQVEGVEQTPEGLTVLISAAVPEICTADMAAWLIFLRIPAGTAVGTPSVIIQ